MIKVENLSVCYKNSYKPVLFGLNLSIKKGDTVAIIGPSGCGKTTLLNVIAGLITKKEAEVTGKIHSSGTVRYVFQEPRLLPWQTALENVSFGLEAEGTRKDQAHLVAQGYLEMVGLSEYKGYYPNQLSGGMKQRINFARAIATAPEVILLDEPFSSLDQETAMMIKKEFKTIIRRLNITALYVTHQVSEAEEFSDRVLTLKDGKLTVRGVNV
jgi:ABC-type nitrate/sulfonate/bicarbonate transport system ATPase subunit